MKIKKHEKYFGYSPYHFAGLAAILLSILLFFINAKLSAAPILLFALLCAVAPFMTKLSFFLPVISRGTDKEKTIALTFDDGPDPDVTPTVLKLLSKHSANATFFVTGQNALLHPDIIRQIIAQGHSIGNHSYKHDPLLMLRRKKTVYNEIKSTQDILNKFGITPRAFRPPAGITNPRLRPVLQELNMYCINWSLRAHDAGNRRINGLAKKILKKAKSGDIILLHDINPKNDDTSKLFTEIEQILDGLRNSGFSIIPLSEHIGKEVMKT